MTPPATIWVIAGPNGAGKSSVIGKLIREHGGDYFNPDEYTRKLGAQNAGLPAADANALAWAEGVRRLEEAVEAGSTFAFETTLGGKTISRLLHRAADRGMALRMWYIALDSADRHVARVKARAARGGHDIPEERIRARYDSSRANLARLVPKPAALKVFDNSVEADRDMAASPRLVLEWAAGRVVNRDELANTPNWAKAIVAAALKAER